MDKLFPEASQSTLRVSWMLMSLLVLGCVGAILITALYLKTLQEKRASQVSSRAEGRRLSGGILKIHKYKPWTVTLLICRRE